MKSIRRGQSFLIDSFPKLNKYEIVLLLYVNYTLLYLMGGFIAGERVASLIGLVLRGILLAYTVYAIIRERMRIDLFFILFAYTFFLLLSVAITPSLFSIAQSTLRSFLFCFEGYYLFSRMRSLESVERILPYCALLLVPYSLLIFTSSTIEHADNSDYFPISYGIIVQVSLLYLMGYRKPVYCVVAVVGTVVILFAGARGAFACVVVALALYVVFRLLSGKGVKRLALLALAVVGACVLVIGADQLVNVLYGLMPDSRTLRRFTSGAVSYDLGRQTIYQNILAEVTANPFAFRGILSDRLIGARSLGWAVSAGTYAHNIIFEMLYQFGLFLGGLILLGLLYLIIRSFKVAYVKGNDAALIILIVLLSCSVVQLMFSSSYLICSPFWCFLGWALALLHPDITSGKIKGSSNVRFGSLVRGA